MSQLNDSFLALYYDGNKLFKITIYDITTRDY